MAKYKSSIIATPFQASVLQHVSLSPWYRPVPWKKMNFSNLQRRTLEARKWVV